MKKIFTILTAILITATAWAQSPEKMSYQSVIRNSSDQLVTNTSIGIQISILQTSVSGTPVYIERHFPTTNANGLVSLEIGTGTVISGNFTTIDWANDIYFLKTETDLNGGASYTITGTSQLLSVPYALHAKTAGTADYNSLTNLPTLFDEDWSSLIGTAPNVSIFNNDAGYLTSISETDPIFGAWDKTTGISITESQISDFGTYLTSYTESDPIFTAWDKTSGISITESQITDFGTYLTSYTEIQTLSDVISNNASAGNANITNLADPVNDQDAATKAYIDEILLQAGVYTEKDYDCNVFKTVKIGNQIWMAENLKVTHYADGTAIPLVTDNTVWANLGDNNTDKAYCYYNNNAGGEAATYGPLYTYAAATNGDNSGTGVQGVCPNGWHLPSDVEWKELEMELGMSQADTDVFMYRGTDQGSQLAGNAALWTDGNLEFNANFGKSGFTALPGGRRTNSEGISVALGSITHFWLATENNATLAYFRAINSYDSRVYRGYTSKSLGYSVRCLQD